ncbi:FAD-binding oxidoreductase [Novosphingobium sp.]|uniref:FAD-binding oxidoreductase n=1 Tax=Novosphingobium sp. TaxID=1874826 RepID=UPI002FDF8D07
MQSFVETSVHPDAERLETARRRFVAELGAEAVRDDEIGVKEFHDPYEGPGAVSHQPSLIVQPVSVEQIQAAVRIAAETGVHLWTSSMGRNFGYGGSAPAANGAIVLNLRRMNRILDIDPKNCFALLEPGVTFQQLYEEIRRQGLPLAMSVPDLGWGSIIGNALDHGMGYHVMGDHASSLCGLEVVLADGALVRTGQGAITGSPLWSCHRRGFGPSMDDLFKQSNFGIVTKAGVWLTPRPEQFAAGFIRCHQDEDVIRLVDMLRTLMLEGVLQGTPMLLSSPRAMADEGEAGGGRYTMANLRSMLPPGRWNARFGLYGNRRMVDARSEILKEAVATIPGAMLDLQTYPGDVDPHDVAPPHLVPAGIPNQFLKDQFESIFDQFGHMDCSPVIPMTGEMALKVEKLVSEILSRHGLLGAFGAGLTNRSMICATMILFDKSDQDRVTAAKLAVGQLYDEIAKWGCAPYRAHISLVDQVADKQDYNNHALAKLYQKLKGALDPSGILSPGNHGIWPVNSGER